jgi:hypothetical protein
MSLTAWSLGARLASRHKDAKVSGETWTLSFVIDAKEGDCFHTLWERIWSLDWVMKKGHILTIIVLYRLS